MKPENKIIQKYALPYYIGATFFLCIAGATFVVSAQQVKEAKAFAQRNPDVQTDNSLDLLTVFLVITSVCFSFYGFHTIPNMGRKKARDLTHRYITAMLTKHPELGTYSDVLSNKETLEVLSAVVCNGLSDQEQKQIISIAKKYDHIEAKSDIDETKQINDIDEQILAVVKKHVLKDPEYIKKIKATLINLQKTYVIRPVQRTR